jgi:hypothetical protein
MMVCHVGVLTGYKQQKKEWNVLYDGWKKYILNQAIQGVYIGFWATSIKNKSIYWYKASGGRRHTLHNVTKVPTSLAMFLGCVYILRLQMRWAWLEAKEKKNVSITVLWQIYLIIPGPLNLSMLHLIQFNFRFFILFIYSLCLRFFP